MRNSYKHGNSKDRQNEVNRSFRTEGEVRQFTEG